MPSRDLRAWIAQLEAEGELKRVKAKVDWDGEIPQVVKKVYEQAPKPCVVIAVGACACGQGIFAKGPYTPNPVDSLLPVDIYIPGCPPKPEGMILAIVKLIAKLKGKG